MRLAGREFDPGVVVAPGTTRPIRMRLCGLSFMLDKQEAIQLATQLADAATQLREETP